MEGGCGCKSGGLANLKCRKWGCDESAEVRLYTWTWMAFSAVLAWQNLPSGKALSYISSSLSQYMQTAFFCTRDVCTRISAFKGCRVAAQSPLRLCAKYSMTKNGKKIDRVGSVECAEVTDGASCAQNLPGAGKTKVASTCERGKLGQNAEAISVLSPCQLALSEGKKCGLSCNPYRVRDKGSGPSVKGKGNKAVPFRELWIG
eukprot:scaffold52963_cov14-Tisochrysis_lutea.AAC.1